MPADLEHTQTSQAFKVTMATLGKHLPKQLGVMRRAGKSMRALTAPVKRK